MSAVHLHLPDRLLTDRLVEVLILDVRRHVDPILDNQVDRIIVLVILPESLVRLLNILELDHGHPGSPRVKGSVDLTVLVELIEDIRHVLLDEFRFIFLLRPLHATEVQPTPAHGARVRLLEPFLDARGAEGVLADEGLARPGDIGHANRALHLTL